MPTLPRRSLHACSLLLMAACASEARTLAVEDADSSANANAMRGGSANPQAGSQTQGALQVSLHAAQSACPEDCTTLTAQVINGVPPYKYSWSDPALSGPGPHVLCGAPGTVTTLSVEDSASSAEFGGPQSAHVSYARRAGSCDDAPDAPPVTACASLTIAIAPGPGAVPNLWAAADADAQGNVYVAGSTFDNVVILPGGRRLDPNQPIAGVTRTFLAKYDAGCTLAWSRWLGDAERPTELGSLDVDEDGQIAVTTVAVTDSHSPGAAGTATSGVTLWSVGPDGNTTWSILSPNGAPLHNSMGGNGVRWGSDGSLAVMGLTQLCVERDPENYFMGPCVARIDRRGIPVFARAIPRVDGAGVALDGTGALYASGLSVTGGSLVDYPGPWQDRSVAYVVKYTPSGELAWRRERSGDLTQIENWIQGFVDVNARGEATGIWYQANAQNGNSKVHSWTIAADGTPNEPVTYSLGAAPVGLYFAGSPDGTIASATRLDGSSTGALSTESVQHWTTRGEGATVHATGQTRAGGVQDLQVTPRGLHVLTQYDALPDSPQLDVVRITTF